MSRFTAIDAADKAALKARALSLKPRALNVVATALGWSQSRPNGQLELLVSFRDLDDLLGDLSSDQEATAEPITVTPEAAPVEPVVEAPVADATTDTTATDDTAAAPKKAGRPKKVDTTVATDSTATDVPAIEQAAQ